MYFYKRLQCAVTALWEVKPIRCGPPWKSVRFLTLRHYSTIILLMVSTKKCRHSPYLSPFFPSLCVPSPSIPVSLIVAFAQESRKSAYPTHTGMFGNLTPSSNCLGKHSFTCTINSKRVCGSSVRAYIYIFSPVVVYSLCVFLCVQ